jgi:hypothetical protein
MDAKRYEGERETWRGRIRGLIEERGGEGKIERETEGKKHLRREREGQEAMGGR